MTKIANDPECAQFQRKLLAARTRWEREVITNAFANRTAPGHGNGGKEKVLYLVRGGAWLDKIRREIQQFQKRLDARRLNGRTGQRTLWLPAIIDRPRKITLKIYAATSTRSVNRASARAFAKKGVPLNGNVQIFEGSSMRKFVVRSRTGATYRLRIRYKGGKIDYVGFTNWAVCVCESKEAFPKLRKSKGPLAYKDDAQPGAAYRHGKTTLYYVDPD